MRVIKAGAAALLITLFSGVMAASQEPVESLRGISADEAVSRFGEPDSKRETSPGHETWIYGKSLLIFADGKVLAWSDSGTLSSRENLASIKAAEKKEETDKKAGWPNAWTPQEQPAVGDELDEITR